MYRDSMHGKLPGHFGPGYAKGLFPVANAVRFPRGLGRSIALASFNQLAGRVPQSYPQSVSPLGRPGYREGRGKTV